MRSNWITRPDDSINKLISSMADAALKKAEKRINESTF